MDNLQRCIRKIDIIKSKLLYLYNFKVVNVSFKGTFIIFKIKHLSSKKYTYYSLSKYELLSVSIDYLVSDIVNYS